MKFPRSSLLVIAAAGLLSIAWGPGGAGTNGLLASYYQGNKKGITTDLFKDALPPSANPAPTQVAHYTSSPYGLTLIKDAIGCALPSGQGRTYGTETFFGQNLMSQDVGWLTGPLNQVQMNDVHTCLLARLNKFGVEVPIFLWGPRVRTVFPNYQEYRYPEAIWVATVADPLDVTMDVWPLGALQELCGNDNAKIDEAINLRVCGTSATCGVKVHHGDLANRCDHAQNGWSCAPTATGPKHPAVATRLGPCGWAKIYAEAHCPLKPAPGPNDCLHGEP